MPLYLEHTILFVIQAANGCRKQLAPYPEAIGVEETVLFPLFQSQ